MTSPSRAVLARPQAGRQGRGQRGLGGTNGIWPWQPPELTRRRRLLPGLVAPDPAGGFGCQPGWALHKGARLPLDAGGVLIVGGAPDA